MILPTEVKKNKKKVLLSFILDLQSTNTQRMPGNQIFSAQKQLQLFKDE